MDNQELSSTEQLQKQFEEIQRQTREMQNTPLDQECLYAAAVRVCFDPKILKPFHLKSAPADSGPSETGWRNFFSFSEPVGNMGEKNAWQLRTDVRVKALVTLKNEGLLEEAIASIDEAEKNKSQLMLEKLIRGETVDVEILTREELVDLLGMVPWVSKIVPLGDLKDKLEKALPLADLMAPFDRLLKAGFFGRKKELADLAAYAGISSSIWRKYYKVLSDKITTSDSADPLMIIGPGGVGKSSLIANFLFTYGRGNNSDGLYFAYLNVDRPVVDPRNMLTFLLEAVRQLEVQVKGFDFESLKLDILDQIGKKELREFSKDFTRDANYFTTRFSQLVNRLDRPFIMVIDTFEEVQFMGESSEYLIRGMIAGLHRSIPSMRTILSGRSKVNSYKSNIRYLELPDLERSEALELLTADLEKENGLDPATIKKTASTIIDIAGLNPMSLRLALTIVKDQGIESLQKVETKSWLLIRVKENIIQGRLYGRILAHLHDDDLKKLAFPGLVVRRIDPFIIREVLAGPCKIELKEALDAEILYNKLALEVSLIEPDVTGMALMHRQDVRKLMLGDMRQEVEAAVIQKVHNNAVKYYGNQPPTPVNRAEEIYHRLCRGDAPETCEVYWIEGVDVLLRTALEEVPPAAGIWLSGKLRITPDASLLQKMDLQQWENVTLKTVQLLVSNGEPRKALELLRERENRTTESPLLKIEIELLRTLGLFDEADVVIGQMIETQLAGAGPAFMADLFVQAALVKEAMQQWNEALMYIEKARQLQEKYPERNKINYLSTIVANIRIYRKLGNDIDQKRKLLIDEAMSLLKDDDVMKKLFDRPSLINEIVAELGKLDPEILNRAIRKVGVNIYNEEDVELLSHAFESWNYETSRNVKGLDFGELARRAGLSAETGKDWTEFIKDNMGRQLNSKISHWRSELSSNESTAGSVANFDKQLVEIFRHNVDMSIGRGLKNQFKID